ncbi:MAG: Ig-like domain-containing protein [Gemmatimonadota bacterium]|nr:Ig-like domain-containing protein [Gemmatimonadota bacterium]
MRKLIACIFLCGCASQGMPPGGPPDTQAPTLLLISPDSGRTMVKTGATARFRFDEVVSERPAGATTLGDLFVVSPRQGVPNVSWHREEIHVKPRKGWLPNTTYSVTMLPGIADLRGNVRNTPVTTYFSTGPRVDSGAIAGSVYVLLTSSAAGGAIVEARAGTDSTVAWITRTDSAGGFRLEHLPKKKFAVRAYLDKNRNFGADADEPSDTATVAAVDSAVPINLFVVLRDSIAPKMAAVSLTDSVTLAVTFDRAADSASATTIANYTLSASDSSVIGILSVRPPVRDSLHKRPPTTRPLPLNSVTLSLAHPLGAKVQYRLRAVGIRGLLGQTLPSELPLSAAGAQPPDKRPPTPTNLPSGAVPLPIKRD